MFFNNVHILVYLGIGIIGLIVGKFCAWCNVRLPENKKIFSKEFFEINKKGLEKNYIFMILTAITYIGILYRFGIKEEIYQNLDLVKFLILAPMLILSFFIDLKHRILPNRVNLTMFEVGLIITFLYGITNLNLAKDMIFGMFVGGLIFCGITLLGGLFAGKEAMGLGDVKLMGALGLYMGVIKIVEVSIAAFFIAAVASIFILIYRHYISKSDDEYIPFGPFLVIGAFICIFAPSKAVITIFLGICGWISQKILGIFN